MAESRRSTATNIALLLVAAGAVASMAVAGTLSVQLRGLVWFAAALVKLLAVRHRHEPGGTWPVLALGNTMIGVGWLVEAAGVGVSGVGESSQLLLAVGLGLVAWGTILGAPGDRSRTAVLDGLLAALALSLAASTAWLGVHGMGIATVGLLSAFLLLWAALATPCVMAAMLLSGHVRASTMALPTMLSSATLLAAVMVTTSVGVAGGVEGRLSAVLWVLTPVVTSAVLASGRPVYEERQADHVSGAMSTPRLVVLTLLCVGPVAVAAVVGTDDMRLLALCASLIASLLLVARIVVSIRYEIAHVQATADVRFDALIEYSAEVVALADRDGMLFYVSRPVERAFGIRPQDLVGLPATDLVVGDYLEAWAETLRTAGERPGIPVESQIELIDSRGIPRHVEATVVDLCDLEGVNAVSITVRDVTERVQLETELVRRVRLDDLTGLFNRHVLTDRVAHVLQRREHPCALVYLDVNDFKLVNDSYGHAAGDAVLKAIAERIQQSLRRADTPGRMGGDEFAILLEELRDPERDIAIVTERIHAACAMPIRIAENERVVVRVAVGVALPTPGMTAPELFQAADAAMYVAKREHRPTVVFEPSMSVSNDSRLRLMQDVGHAIEQGTFEMHYQPIVHLDTGAFAGAEALLRWHHPTLGRVLPHHFLDHADAAGLTSELTDAIARKIRTDLDAWWEVTGTPLHVAMNLSAEQLARVDAGALMGLLMHDGQAHGYLTIEVTETSMLGDVAAVAEVLDDFRAAGCHVAIDDFGTGHASIGYLRTLPVDHLKIDREFVKDLSHGAAVSSFAATIHRLACDLSLATVAEGIETAEQHEAVRAIGCKLGQGWLFGRPMPMSDLLAAHGGKLVASDVVPALVESSEHG